MIRWLGILYVIKLLKKCVTLTAAPNSVDVSMAPNLEDFLATECREILDILLEMVVFPSSKYFNTENIAHVGYHIYPQISVLNYSKFLYLLHIWKYRISRPIRRTVIFSLEILEKK